MFQHRKGSHRPDGKLIGRFQELCGGSFFNRSGDSDKHHLSCTDEGDKVTPSEGACKKMKENPQLNPLDPFSFDGCPPADSLDPPIIDNTTSFQDLLEGRSSTFNNNIGLSSDWNESDQFGKPATLGSLEDFNTSQLPMDMESFNVQGAWMPNDSISQNPDFTDIGLSAEPHNINYRMWDTIEDIPPDFGDTIAHPQAKFHPAKELEGERFRYHTVLRAPTAMLNDSDDSPVTYLNKGQTYQLTLEDSMSSATNMFGPNKYQTFIRISFDEDQQRSDPAAYWQLWKTARGLNESNNDDGSLQAVEFQGQDNPLMQIEQVSLDGFCVTWTSNPADSVSRCSIPIRFNFLSTDFTLSKGVKGMKVRLCAKTKQLGEVDVQEPEICFCNVKLFRDHGAERKLSNDAIGIQKRIEKLKLQINEPDPPDASWKRKRGNTSMTSNPFLSYSKSNLKSQRGQQSDTSGGGPNQKGTANQLHKRLDSLQKTKDSIHPQSVLDLRAGDRDDPELHPYSPLKTHETEDHQNHSASSISNTSSPHSRLFEFDGTSSSRSVSSVHDETNSDTISPSSSKPAPTSSSSKAHPSRLPISSGSQTSQVSEDKAACFYIRLWNNTQSPKEHYRAIYPRTRTVSELLSKISEKGFFEIGDVSKTLHVNQAGLKIMVDDEFVQQMAEGQDMLVKVVEIPTSVANNKSVNAKYEVQLEY